MLSANQFMLVLTLPLSYVLPSYNKRKLTVLVCSILFDDSHWFTFLGEIRGGFSGYIDWHAGVDCMTRKLKGNQSVQEINIWRFRFLEINCQESSWITARYFFYRIKGVTWQWNGRKAEHSIRLTPYKIISMLFENDALIETMGY